MSEEKPKLTIIEGGDGRSPESSTIQGRLNSAIAKALQNMHDDTKLLIDKQYTQVLAKRFRDENYTDEELLAIIEEGSWATEKSANTRWAALNLIRDRFK